MILYDLTALQPHENAPVHGGGRFAEYVLVRMLNRHLDFKCIYDSSLPISSKILNTLKEQSVTLLDVSGRSVSDVIVRTDNTTIFSILPRLEYCHTKCVGTIHDCREMETPYDWFFFLYPFSLKTAIRELLCRLFSKYRLKLHVKQLDTLYNHPNFYPTTITRYSKNRLYFYYPNKRFKNINIFKTPFADYGAAIERNNIKDDYFLLVSGNRMVKNILRALIAFDRMAVSGNFINKRVIVTGIDSLCFFKYKFKHPELIETLGYVSGEKLQDLYRHAYAFVFPSLYEGFGIPPLEAMRVGTPVLAAFGSAIPEICGNAALYFNPFSIKEMQIQMATIINDQNLYRELQNKGYDNYSRLKVSTDQDLDEYIDYVMEVDKNEKCL